MSKYYFIINVISYLFMFILFFFSVSYKKVIFMVNFTNESLSANLLIKNFRNFLFNVTAFFFSLSLIFNNFLYFGLMNFLYFLIIIFKYFTCCNEMKKIVFSNSDLTKSSDRFLYLDYFSLSLSFFLTLYNFYIIFDKRLSEDILFLKTLYIIPLTLFYLNLFVLFTIKLINSGSDFNVKEVKKHIINLLIIISYTVSFSFIIYSQYAVKSVDFTALVNCFMATVLSLIYIIMYLRYIKEINKKFEFNVLREKVTNGKVIEINLTGTKLFINFKNKKSYLLLTGFILFILSYIWLVYLLTI